MISGGTKCPGCKCPAFARACRNMLVAVENIGCQLALCTRQTPAANVRSLQIRLLPIFFCMLLSGHVSRVDRYSSCMVQVDLLSA